MRVSVYFLYRLFYWLLGVVVFGLVIILWLMNDYHENQFRQHYVSHILKRESLQVSHSVERDQLKNINPSHRLHENGRPLNQGHTLGVLVPFRNRFNQLLHFVPHISRFLLAQNITFHIFVMNQVDQYRFNRASLINVGYLRAIENSCDYVAMHDVDLLPLNPSLSYAHVSNGHAMHLSASGLHPKYDYPRFVGGILILNTQTYELVNGMSNRYWGWGLEDDEFYYRLKEHQIQIDRPSNLSTNKSNTFLHLHDASIKRDTIKLFNQRQASRKRDRQTGVFNTKYEIEKELNLRIEDFPFTVINVKLICDKLATPWCEQPSLKKKV